METTRGTDAGTTFTLWHIPSSTLLVTTRVPGEVVQLIESVVADGVALSELMLNVEQRGTVMGEQHIGPRMLVALRATG